MNSARVQYELPKPSSECYEWKLSGPGLQAAPLGDAQLCKGGSMTPAPFLEVKKASVAYGATTVLEGIDLAIAKGEFVALLGSSG